LRINIDKTNVDTLKDLDEYFNKMGWYSNKNFYANAAAVDSETFNPAIITKAELVKRTLELKDSCNSSIFSYENFATDILNRCLVSKDYPFKRVSYCSAQSGLLIFDPLGDVYSCWDEVGQAPNRIGTYDAQGIKFNKEVVLFWLSRFPGSIEECSVCPYALIHTSGCAMHARQASGTMFSPACESFQEYFPDILSNAYQNIEDLIMDKKRKNSMTKLPILR